MISSEVRRRSWRLQVIQQRVDAALALSQARAEEYANEPGGSTGLLVKDYRGKNTNQVVWKFDSALEARIADNLKQARSRRDSGPRNGITRAACGST